MNRSRWIALISAFVVAAWLVGLVVNLPKTSGSEGGGTSPVSKAPSGSVNMNEGSQPQPDTPNTYANGTNFGGAASIPTVGPKIVKRGDVDLRVNQGGLNAALQAMTRIAQRYGGVVVSTDFGGLSTHTGTVVISVPVDHFESALGDVLGLGKLTQEHVSGRDVSGQFVDLQARLRNDKVQEAVLQRLMRHAKTVPGTIAVQQQLSTVQAQIEQLQGQLRYLQGQTAMSTITVGFSFPGVVVAQYHPGILQRAWRQATTGFLGVIGAVLVGLAYLLPVAIIAAIVAQIGIVARRRWGPTNA